MRNENLHLFGGRLIEIPKVARSEIKIGVETRATEGIGFEIVALVSEPH